MDKMSELNVGDRVVCVNDDGWSASFRSGVVYEVTEIWERGADLNGIPVSDRFTNDFRAYQAQSESDWIDWHGGEMPVPYGTLVDVEYNDGNIAYGLRAGDDESSYDTGFGLRRLAVYWDNRGLHTDIIRYRLHKSEQRSVTLRGQVTGDTMTFTFDGSSPTAARLEAARRELEAAQAAYEAECRQWEPQYGEWVIMGDGDLMGECHNEDYAQFGTERPTRQLAEQARDAMRVHNRALAYVHEHAPEWDGSEPCSVYWSFTDKAWSASKEHVPPVGTVTGPRHVMERLAEDLNSGRVKL